MADDLFSSPPEYTIDSSSLMEMFNDTSWASKRIIPGLWENVEDLIRSGVIISHAEVLAEIKKDGKKGEELFTWAHQNSGIFQPHQPDVEGSIIRLMTPRYKDFVNNWGKPTSAYADPWLIAQAKNRGLKLITEETKTGSTDPAKFKLPNVCADPQFGVKCLNLRELVLERGWSFRR